MLVASHRILTWWSKILESWCIVLLSEAKEGLWLLLGHLLAIIKVGLLLILVELRLHWLENELILIHWEAHILLLTLKEDTVSVLVVKRYAFTSVLGRDYLNVAVIR